MTTAITRKSHPESQSQAKAAIVQMLVGLRDRSGNPEVTASSYLYAARELPLDVVTGAAEQFLRGEVPGQNTSFPPTTAEFCAYARKIPSERFKALAPPRDPVDEISAEERARVGQAMTAWVDERKAKKRATDAEGREKQHAEIEARLDANLQQFGTIASPALQRLLEEATAPATQEDGE